MDEVIWRTLSKGRCFVYLLACRDEDTQKIGFARDPWVRLGEFHPRFPAFFDLDRGALIETDRVGDARAIERQLISDFKSYAGQAPLRVRERAGGKHEWFRGIHPQAMARMHAQAESLGYPFHASLGDWLRRQWMGRAEVIADWSRATYERLEILHFHADREISEPQERSLRVALERWESIGIPIEEWLGPQALQWYRWGFDP